MIFSLSLFTVCLCLSLALSFFFYRKYNQWPILDRLTLSLLFPLAVCLATLFLLKNQGALYSEYNWERLQNAFVLARGFSLYNGPEIGPVLISIYGPLSIFMYLPAAFAPSPTFAMRLAEFLLTSYFFLPAFWLHWKTKREEAKRDPKFLSFQLLVFLIFCYFPFISKPLRDAAFNIHVDGPTLCLITIACGLLYFRKPRAGKMSLFFSAVFAVLSVWSKQVAVPLLIALPLYLLLTEGWKTAWRYGLYLLVSGVVISAVILLIFDPQKVIFNILVIPANHSLRKGGFAGLIEATFILLGEAAAVLTLASISLGFLFFKSRPTKWTDWIRSWRGSIFLIVALLMIPTSILGNAKVGGSTNTLSYVCYFLLLAATLGFLDLAANRVIRFFLMGLSVLFLCIEIPWGYSYIVAFSREVNAVEIAFAYIKKHPGEAYFPRLNMLNIMAENKVYHASAALKDREWAKMPITPDHFSAHLPSAMKFLAFQKKTATDKDVLDRYLPEYSVETTDPELPGFVIFKKDYFSK